MLGKLYMIPTTLGESGTASVIPVEVAQRVLSIRYFVVENIRTARRYLRELSHDFPIDDCTFFELNKHTNPTEVSKYIKPCQQGFDLGMISEAGCPGVADPGADVAALAHANGIDVVPLVGPSSILMALMSSGFNGQSFAFNGYISVKTDRIKQLQQYEHLSMRFGQTQIFMDAPYRNQKLLEDILQYCAPSTMLCIATDITLPTEFIRTKSVGEWRKSVPDINKRPTMFVLHRFK